jgi:hypothetical protein
MDAPMELNIASEEDGTDELTASWSILEETTTLLKTEGIPDALGESDGESMLEAVELA